MQQNQPRDSADRPGQSEPLGLVAEQAMQQVGHITDTARQQGFTWLADQKIQASGTLETTARAFAEVGHRLEQQGQPSLGQSISMAGEKIEQFSRTLKDREIDELYSEVEDLARRQPVYFLGGALILGVLAARFVKSAAQTAGKGSQLGSASRSGGTNVITGPFAQSQRTASWPAELRTSGGDMARPSSPETSPRPGNPTDLRREPAAGIDS